MDSYSTSYYTSMKLYFNLKSRMAIRESEYRKKSFLDSTNIIECILCQASLSHRRLTKANLTEIPSSCSFHSLRKKNNKQGK